MTCAMCTFLLRIIVHVPHDDGDRSVDAADKQSKPAKPARKAPIKRRKEGEPASPNSISHQEPLIRKRFYQQDWFHLSSAASLMLLLYTLMQMYPTDLPAEREETKAQRELARIERMTPYERCREAAFSQPGLVSAFGLKQVEANCVRLTNR